ncbi:hypothetical protein HY493_01090 [Candidatus Woesearchaeota archaeon]|nr:hypothetical protein [Candidatus Woesearchaeota archaeon]
MAEQKDRQLRLILGIILILMGLPGFGFVRGMMSGFMMSGYGMMGYAGGANTLFSIAALAVGIWLVIDASRK